MKPIAVGDTIMFAYGEMTTGNNRKIHRSAPVLNFETSDTCIAIETVDGTVYVLVEESDETN